MDTTDTTQNPAPIQISGSPSRPRRPLSDREMYVLSKIAELWTNKDIAVNLGVNPVTVTNILHRIYEQLDVTNRMGAVIRGIQLGLIVLPPIEGAVPEQANGQPVPA